MVALCDVQISRGGTLLFQHVNWQFAPASITAVRKTGVLDGSSTLLMCCAGLVKPDKGVVKFNDADIQTLSEKERYTKLNYCYESGGLISLFTVYNNIATPLIYHDICTDNEAFARITQIAEELEIRDLLEYEPHQLNDVQVRLVNLMRALVLDAQVILIDELQTGMSEKMFAGVVEVLKRCADRGHTVVMVTTSGDHDEFADHHLVIANKNLELRY